jgi:hypothetical protein
MVSSRTLEMASLIFPTVSIKCMHISQFGIRHPGNNIS